MHDLHNLVIIELQNGNGFQNTTCTTEIEHLIKIIFCFFKYLIIKQQPQNESDKLKHKLNSEQRASLSKHLESVKFKPVDIIIMQQ